MMTKGNVMSSISMPPSIPSRADLLERLVQDSGGQATLEQLDEQKISFIYGNLPASSKITREQVAARVTRSRAVA